MTEVYVLVEELENGERIVHGVYGQKDEALIELAQIDPLTPDRADKEITRRNNTEGLRRRILRQSTVLRLAEGRYRFAIDVDLFEPVEGATSHVNDFVQAHAYMIAEEVIGD